jgi:N-acetyl-gamma-glutamyl-phosphate reductase
VHTPVAVFGASGYSGLELTKILTSHPEVTLAVAASERWQGDRIRDHLPVSGAAGETRYRPPDAALDAAAPCTVAFLATPAESSARLVPELLARGVSKVIDLSGAFRLRDATLYPRFYSFTHPAPELLREAVYGLPELSRSEIRAARLIANPGCYPTVSSLAVAPLLANQLCEPWIVADAKSGVTGAGRKATEDLSFSEVSGDFRAYRVGRHQHEPEIVQNLAQVASGPVALTFTAHLLPVPRGILATCYARLKDTVSPESVEPAFAAFCRNERFLRHATPEAVTLKAAVGTNLCVMGASVDPETRMVRAFAAIDNLIKGAAGQAVQNMNLMLGLDEGLGLTEMKGFYP